MKDTAGLLVLRWLGRVIWALALYSRLALAWIAVYITLLMTIDGFSTWFILCIACLDPFSKGLVKHGRHTTLFLNIRQL